MFDVQNILDRLGYPIAIRGRNCACPTIYRGGDTPTGLFVNESGVCHDQITKESFSITQFVARVLDCPLSEAEKFVGSTKTVEKQIERIETPPDFDIRDIQNLTDSFKFYNDRGITNETLKTFGAGLCHSGKYNMRIVFPIMDKNKVIGVAARDVMDRDPKKKWKLSKRENFVYPLHLSKPYIVESRKVVLVESVGDMLALWQAGIRNVLVVFGLGMSKKMELALVSLNPSKILIGLNVDENGRGQAGAAKIKKKLSTWFSPEVLVDAPPYANDFGDMTPQQIEQWKNEKKI